MAQCDPKNKERKKKDRLRHQNMWHVTCPPRPPTSLHHHMDLHILRFIKIRSGVLEPRGSKFDLFHYFGYWVLQQLYHKAVMDCPWWFDVVEIIPFSYNSLQGRHDASIKVKLDIEDHTVGSLMRVKFVPDWWTLSRGLIMGCPTIKID